MRYLPLNVACCVQAGELSGPDLGAHQQRFHLHFWAAHDNHVVQQWGLLLLLHYQLVRTLCPQTKALNPDNNN
jgi:hypothetical protein